MASHYRQPENLKYFAQYCSLVVSLRSKVSGIKEEQIKKKLDFGDCNQLTMIFPCLVFKLVFEFNGIELKKKSFF